MVKNPNGWEGDNPSVGFLQCVTVNLPSGHSIHPFNKSNICCSSGSHILDFQFGVQILTLILGFTDVVMFTVRTFASHTSRSNN